MSWDAEISGESLSENVGNVSTVPVSLSLPSVATHETVNDWECENEMVWGNCLGWVKVETTRFVPVSVQRAAYSTRLLGIQLITEISRMAISRNESRFVACDLLIQVLIRRDTDVERKGKCYLVFESVEARTCIRNLLWYGVKMDSFIIALLLKTLWHLLDKNNQ